MLERLSTMSYTNLPKFNISHDQIDVFEGMVSVRAVFDGIASGACNRKIKKVLFSEKNIKGNGKLLGFLKARSFVHSYELEVVDDAAVTSICSGNSHGGIVMLTEKRKYDMFFTGVSDNGFYVLLEGVEDPYNLGFSIRSAYAAGADGILLPEHTPITSAGIVCRSSAGASELVQIICGNTFEAVKSLKSKGYRLVCADMNAPKPSYLSNMKKPIILAVGGERRGFSKELSALSDTTVRLEYGRNFPMALSAASATAILSFEVTRQNS